MQKENSNNGETKKKGKVLKVIGIILLILVILIGGIVAGTYFFINDKLQKIEYEDLPADQIEVNTGVEEQLTGYRNIALLGLDARTDTFDGTRSDCIMIVSINQATKDVKLASVYRDTYLELTNRSLDKITHAYAYGGAKLTLSSLNTNLDLNITEYVTINFDTVKTVVDAVGGVKITVTDAEAKSIPDISSAGTYNLNGSQALAYGRIRKIDTDYKRTERMRDVLTAVFNKVKGLNISELNNLVDTVLPHVRTNIQSSEILALLPQVASYKIDTSIGWPYEVRAYTTPTWYGAPVTLESNVIKLHNELFPDEAYEPSENVKRISNNIIKKTGYR
ncbi:MAG: LCP family protein [Clostridiaceae bacterium]|nr:LCP family protein [Clostridiaceae bacterium]